MLRRAPLQLVCLAERKAFPVIDGIPIPLTADARPLDAGKHTSVAADRTTAS